MLSQVISKSFGLNRWTKPRKLHSWLRHVSSSVDQAHSSLHHTAPLPCGQSAQEEAKWLPQLTSSLIEVIVWPSSISVFFYFTSLSITWEFLEIGISWTVYKSLNFRTTDAIARSFQWLQLRSNVNKVSPTFLDDEVERGGRRRFLVAIVDDAWRCCIGWGMLVVVAISSRPSSSSIIGGRSDVLTADFLFLLVKKECFAMESIVTIIY